MSISKKTWRQTSHNTPAEKMAVWTYPRPHHPIKKYKKTLRTHRIGK